MCGIGGEQIEFLRLQVWALCACAGVALLVLWDECTRMQDIVPGACVAPGTLPRWLPALPARYLEAHCPANDARANRPGCCQAGRVSEQSQPRQHQEDRDAGDSDDEGHLQRPGPFQGVPHLGDEVLGAQVAGWATWLPGRRRGAARRAADVRGGDGCHPPR